MPPSTIPITTPGRDSAGMLLGLAGVTIFSLTLPFTRMAVADFDPAFVTLGRAVVAAMLAALYLLCTRSALPPRAAWLPLGYVAGGCVIGFPWLTSIAMQTVPASHGAVLVGILPLATAVAAAVRGNERPSPGFWLSAVTGTAIVLGFALRQSGGVFHASDLLMLGAVALGAVGYAEGGKLAQSMGGERVICWALLGAAPLLLPLGLWLGARHPEQFGQASLQAWLGFAYVSVFSMFIGFFFWYRGMALGGVARVGQVQLVQPFLTLAGAAVLLGDTLTVANLGFALAVIAVVALGRRTRIGR